MLNKQVFSSRVFLKVLLNTNPLEIKDEHHGPLGGHACGLQVRKV